MQQPDRHSEGKKREINVQVSPTTVAFRHPITIGEWSKFTGNFELPSDWQSPIIHETIKLIQPEFYDKVMDLPVPRGALLFKAIYVHCYCYPDNSSFKDKWHLSFDNRQPRMTFLNLYTVREELRVSCSDKVRKIRNRTVHPWDDKGNPNVPPRKSEFVDAIQEIRQRIHKSGKGFHVPYMELYCCRCKKVITQ